MLLTVDHNVMVKVLAGCWMIYQPSLNHQSAYMNHMVTDSWLTCLSSISQYIDQHWVAMSSNSIIWYSADRGLKCTWSRENVLSCQIFSLSWKLCGMIRGHFMQGDNNSLLSWQSCRGATEQVAKPLEEWKTKQKKWYLLCRLHKCNTTCSLKAYHNLENKWKQNESL